MAKEKNVAPPPQGASFWELFDFIWVRGLGNELHEDGTSQSWTATSLEIAFDGSPDKRSIENWHSRTHMPSPENLRKFSALVSDGDDALRKQWYEALVDTRLEEKRREKEKTKNPPECTEAPEVETEQEPDPSKSVSRRLAIAALGGVAMLALGGVMLMQSASSEAYVENMRICDAAYFDDDTKKCTKHVDVFVHGIDEVFLSFDFNGVAHGAPFERWWIHNGERVAGRTSFNDEAWPGYTFWRPGVLQVGTYVVRLVVEGEVTTQTFYVQAEGFTSDS